MAGVPLPNLTLAAPSQSSASTPFNTPFAVGGGATAGGLSPLVMIAGLVAVVFLVMRKK